jgi:hypothetical protein
MTVLAFSDSIVLNVALKSTMTKLQGTFDPPHERTVRFRSRPRKMRERQDLFAWRRGSWVVVPLRGVGSALCFLHLHSPTAARNSCGVR